MVSNRLPVKVTRIEGRLEYLPSEGGLATGVGSLMKEDSGNLWIGWAGMSFEDPQDMEEVDEGLRSRGMVPVFLTEREEEEFYLGFSNQTLWPAFHYFVQDINYDHTNWETYVEVNRKFARKVLDHVEEGDTVWIHDYQLLLLPGMLREARPDLSIGFFLHIPFPSYEVIRTLPWRADLLNGMLGADYIAFHTFDDMRHFLSSVHRLVGYPHKSKEIELEDRVVVADSLPMGIDYRKYAENAVAPATIRRAKRYREWLGDTKIILSMDRLDYTKGIPNRLRAFGDFLEAYPQYQKKVSLLLIVVPSRDNVPKYGKLKVEIDELVGKINSKFGRLNWTPIHYYYRSFPLNVLGSFYDLSDVAMITPRRDGMNLIAKEYVASRYKGDGVLILSEMAGASKELSEAVLVNPHDKKQMVEAIKVALEMPIEAQKESMAKMQDTLRKYDIFSWVKLFMENLQNAKNKQRERETTHLSGRILERLKSDFLNARKRLIFLDYDGTLVRFTKNPQVARPDHALKRLIARLESSPKNHVVIVSGRDHETLQNWAGDCAVSLVAEHGVWERSGTGEWNNRLKALDESPLDTVLKIMDFYVDRTPGSFREEKSHSLAWHYRNVDDCLGAIRAGELTGHLRQVLDGRYTVLEGNHVVEVKPSDVNKGKAVERWHRKFAPDFTLCIGDDITDEDMFRALEGVAYTVKVGPGNSFARYNLNSVRETRRLLDELASLDEREEVISSETRVSPSAH